MDQRSVGISALVSDEDQFDTIYKEFTGIAKERALQVDHISVYSTTVGEEEIEVEEEGVEYHDENTLVKVREALREAGVLNDDVAQQLINSMQNYGILFRERR